jgi:hypothetical protein
MLASRWMNFIHLHVMSFGGVELELWLYFNYIITNVTLTHVTWTFMVHHQTKLFDVCHVYGFKILKLLIFWKCQHMILCHADIYVTHLHDTWHLVVCRSSTYVKSSQSKKINYKVIESKLKICWNMLKISQNLCKLVEM